MCRFVVYVGDPTPVAAVLYGGGHSLHDQSFRPRELLSGSLNADGYAVAWYHQGRPVRVADTRPVWQNADLPPLLGTIRSTMCVAAVRNATPGMPYGPAALAPMILDRWTFTLNGYVSDFRRLFMRDFRAGLPDDLYGRIMGATDTETLFLMALTEVRGGASLGEALASVVHRVTEAVSVPGRSAQLNMVLTDGEAAAVTRAGSEDRSNSLYVADGCELAPGGVLIASEPLEDSRTWTEVEDGSVLEVDLSQSLTIRHLV